MSQVQSDDQISQSIKNRFTALRQQPVSSMGEKEDIEFQFFKMLILAELLNLPSFLSEKLLLKDSEEMWTRAHFEFKKLQFNQYQEWIIYDFNKALQIEEQKFEQLPMINLDIPDIESPQPFYITNHVSNDEEDNDPLISQYMSGFESHRKKDPGNKSISSSNLQESNAFHIKRASKKNTFGRPSSSSIDKDTDRTPSFSPIPPLNSNQLK